MKKEINLSETQLHQIISETIKSFFKNGGTNVVKNGSPLNSNATSNVNKPFNEQAFISSLSPEFIFESVYKRMCDVISTYVTQHLTEFLKTHEIRISKNEVLGAVYSFNSTAFDTEEGEDVMFDEDNAKRKAWKNFIKNNTDKIKSVIDKAWMKWKQNGGLEKEIAEAEKWFEQENGYPFEFDRNDPEWLS